MCASSVLEDAQAQVPFHAVDGFGTENGSTAASTENNESDELLLDAMLALARPLRVYRALLQGAVLLGLPCVFEVSSNCRRLGSLFGLR